MRLLVDLDLPAGQRHFDPFPGRKDGAQIADRGQGHAQVDGQPHRRDRKRDREQRALRAKLVPP